MWFFFEIMGDRSIDLLCHSFFSLLLSLDWLTIATPRLGSNNHEVLSLGRGGRPIGNCELVDDSFCSFYIVFLVQQEQGGVCDDANDDDRFCFCFSSSSSTHGFIFHDDGSSSHGNVWIYSKCNHNIQCNAMSREAKLCMKVHQLTLTVFCSFSSCSCHRVMSVVSWI